MQDRLNIAVFVDYDNIEIGVKSTLRREFEVSLVLDALKERGDIVAKFAYANWSRQEGATRQMAENAVQMVQRIPSPRGDKNGADINLALDALEMAFTHDHVNAFAVVSGDSDFIPLVNKLKEYGKTVFVVGGKAFTSTILQQNCHEFISFESLLNTDSIPLPLPQSQSQQAQAQAGPPTGDRDREPYRESYRDRKEKRFREREERRREREQREGPMPAAGPAGAPGVGPAPKDQPQQGRPAPLDLALAMPLVERALQVLERRNVQPQLGLLKSTMLQLDSAFNESAYGARSFSDFVEKLKRAELVYVKGTGGRYFIERKHNYQEKALPRPEEALPQLREVLEIHRLEFEESGQTAEDLAAWMKEEYPSFDHANYGFQGFAEFLNFAQDKTVVRLQHRQEGGLLVSLGSEFYPQAPPKQEVKEEDLLTEHDFKQPIVKGQPTATGEIPPDDEPPKATKKRVTRKKADTGGQDKPVRRTRRKASE
ncbi:NYN domain-containing protein [Paludibaculum fermentans]|uniref:NYN domain-containing protein n=1 Tax=Paludibaculum fermentans TaxID=1473598 RepID=A0A7S7SIL5_PALFE|nr:NYN domain-containing protein [Paludibaculum fermentans]QOY85808.1 NYN domain-containing protein [Paludibaculum fermentans]